MSLPDTTSKIVADLRAQLSHAFSDQRGMEALLNKHLRLKPNCVATAVPSNLIREKLSSLHARIEHISRAAASLDADLAMQQAANAGPILAPSSRITVPSVGASAPPCPAHPRVAGGSSTSATPRSAWRPAGASVPPQPLRHSLDMSGIVQQRPQQQPGEGGQPSLQGSAAQARTAASIPAHPPWLGGGAVKTAPGGGLTVRVKRDSMLAR